MGESSSSKSCALKSIDTTEELIQLLSISRAVQGKSPPRVKIRGPKKVGLSVRLKCY